MVTISIAEYGESIGLLLQQYLTKKGLRCLRHRNEEGGDYLLLSPNTETHCDVFLMEKPGCAAGCMADYVTILNADEQGLVPINSKSLLITYGLNPLSTATASSMRCEPEKTCFQYCLQRSIVTLKGKILEPQEFPVVLPHQFPEISGAMGFVTLGLILSFLPEDFIS